MEVSGAYGFGPPPPKLGSFAAIGVLDPQNIISMRPVMGQSDGGMENSMLTHEANG